MTPDVDLDEDAPREANVASLSKQFGIPRCEADRLLSNLERRRREV